MNNRRAFLTAGVGVTALVVPSVANAILYGMNGNTPETLPFKLKYRTGGYWGEGEGRLLTPAEIDGNFAALEDRLRGLEARLHKLEGK